MADQRLRGEECEVRFVVNNNVIDTVTDVRNFQATVQLEVLREGYLGETTDRRDDIFRGIAGSMELHFENRDVFDVIQSIVNRARRRQPGTKISIKASLRFPNGQLRLLTIPDAFFGEFPINFPGRSEYATVGVSFEADDYQVT